MGAFDYLSQGVQQPQIQTQAQTMAQLLPLASLAGNLQLQQNQIQTQQQYSKAVQALGSGQVSLDQIAQQFPLAYAKILSDVKQNQLTQAQIGEAQGKGTEATANAYSKLMSITGQMANGIMQKVQAGQPLTQEDKDMLGGQAQHAATITGLDPAVTGTPSVMAPDTAWGNFASNLASASTSALDAANITHTKAVTPSEIAKNQGGAAEAFANALAAPIKAQAAMAEAGAAQTNAATNRFNAVNPAPVTNALTGGLVAVNRPFTQNGPSPMTAAPVTDAQGNPVQTQLSAAQNIQKPAAEARSTAITEGAQLGTRVQQILPALRELAVSGYNGPLASSEAGKTVLAGLESAGMLTSDAAAKLANMRAGDSMVTELLGPMAKQMSSRGSNMALSVVQNAKPGAENALSTRLKMMDALQADSQNLVKTADAYTKYLGTNPTDLTGSGFQPPTPTLPQTAGQTSGYAVQAPDGKTYQFASDAAANAFKMKLQAMRGQ